MTNRTPTLTYRRVRARARSMASNARNRIAPRTAPGPGRAPDFVGMGTQKAGTSWWFSLLLAHPVVDRPWAGGKELHFIDTLASGPLDESAVQAYHRHFQSPADRVVGEWTPKYLFLPWGAESLTVLAPEARVLVILRDPVDRAISGVTHHVARGAAPDDDLVSQQVGRSDYLPQLVRLFEHIDADRVRLYQYEALRKDPGTWLADTHAFLGLEHIALPAETLRETRNETVVEKWQPPEHVRRIIAANAEASRPQLEALMPGLDWGLWTSTTTAR